MHMPCPKNSSAWQKARQKQRCREVLAASPHLHPSALSHASPSLATREPQSPPVPAASSLSLNQAVAAEWELWPMLMSDVLLSVKTFSQLITENIRSFSLNPGAAFLHPLPQGNSDAIHGGTGDPSVDLQLCQGSWLSSAPLGSTRGAQHPAHAASGSQVLDPNRSYITLRLRLKGPILLECLLTHAT